MKRIILTLAVCCCLPPVTRAQQPPKSPEMQMRIFRLEHTAPSELAADLESLGFEAIIVPQDRNGQLIVRGDKASLDEMEELVRVCDVEAQRPDKSNQQVHQNKIQNAVSDPTTPADSESRREIILELNNASSRLAEALRSELDATSAAGITAASKKKLTDAVTKEFDQRLSLQLTEVELLRNRLALIESRITRRRALRDTIISHRVNQLLSGEAGASNPVAQQPSGHPMPSIQSPMPSVQSPMLAADVASNPNSASRSPDGVDLILVTPQDLHRRMQDAAHTMQTLKGSPMSKVVDSPKYGKITVEQKYKLAQADYAAAKREYEAQVELLQLELKQATVELEATKSDMARIQKLAENRLVSSQELSTAEIKLQRSQLRVDRTRTLLKLFSDILPDSPDKSHVSDMYGADAPDSGSQEAEEADEDSLAEPDSGNDSASADTGASHYTWMGLTAGTVYLTRSRPNTANQSTSVNAYGTIVHHRNRSYVITSDRIAADDVVLKSDTLTATSLRRRNTFPAQILAHDPSLGLCVVARIGNGGELSPNEQMLAFASEEPLIGSQIFSVKLPERFEPTGSVPELVSGRITAMFGVANHDSELIATDLAVTPRGCTPIVRQLANQDCRLVGIVATGIHDDEMVVAHQIEPLRRLLDNARLQDPHVDLTEDERRGVTFRTDLRLEE